jgi:hypothetical protein
MADVFDRSERLPDQPAPAAHEQHGWDGIFGPTRRSRPPFRIVFRLVVSIAKGWLENTINHEKAGVEGSHGVQFRAKNWQRCDSGSVNGLL